MPPSRRTLSRRPAAAPRASRSWPSTSASRASPSAAGEERRDRQEELVDEPGREQGAEDVRPALGEDQPVPARAQERERGAEVDRSTPAPTETTSVRCRQPAARCAGAVVGREHERAALERRVAGIDAAGSREDDELGPRAGARRRGGSAKASAVAGDGPSGVQSDARRGAQRARADHDRVRARAQEPHHEAVGSLRRRSACSTGSSAGSRRRRRRSDEVREEPRLVEAERPAVASAVPPAGRTPASPRLVEQLERALRPAVHGDARARDRRAASLQRKAPTAAMLAGCDRAGHPVGRHALPGSPACRSPRAGPR